MARFGGLGDAGGKPALSTDTHHLAGGSAVSGAAAEVGGAQLGLALPLVGWLLACYFLLHAIGALTRRRGSGVVAAGRSAFVRDAAMGLGMTAMLLAML
ncbi:MAG: DUF5134 domain-containing protein [Pseudonocardia sp.]